MKQIIVELAVIAVLIFVVVMQFIILRERKMTKKKTKTIFRDGGMESPDFRDPETEEQYRKETIDKLFSELIPEPITLSASRLPNTFRTTEAEIEDEQNSEDYWFKVRALIEATPVGVTLTITGTKK
jgi:hypothetical protein